MTQETVIHGMQPESNVIARCGEEQPETATTNPGSLTCAPCILDVRSAERDAIMWHRNKLYEHAEALRVLDGDDGRMGQFVKADSELESAIANLNLRIARDAMAEGASDA
jgi:hypothetical protein